VISLWREEACERLAAAAGLTPVRLPAAIAEARSERGGAHLRSHAWAGTAIDSLRITTITDNAGTIITNIGLFPAPTSALPLIQAETVILRGKLFLTILDATLPPGEPWQFATTPPETLLASLQHPLLPPSPDRPEWCRDLISAAAIWTRPNTAEAIAPAAEAEALLLQWSLDLLQSASQASNFQHTREAFLRALREQFIVNEPSRAYLKNVFGAEWAEHYIREFLFAQKPGSSHATPAIA